MKPSSGPNWPSLLEAPGDGAPPTPPPSMLVGAVGRVVGVTEVEVAVVEALAAEVVKGSTDVMRLVETRVVVTRPEPRPTLVVTEVKTTVVFWAAAVVVALPVVEAAVVEPVVAATEEEEVVVVDD